MEVYPMKILSTRSIQKSISALFLAIAVSGFSSVSLSLEAKSPKPNVGKVPVKEVIIEQTVNINLANAEEIAAGLKGVGLKKAQAIVEWRKNNGKFTQLEQLMEVKGIGEKTLEINKALIKI
jgi:competence protein ComEA